MIYQFPRKQADQIPVSFCEAWEAFVSEPSRDLPETLSTWSFIVAVAEDLRWDDLLHDAPATTVLMREGLIGFAAKTRTREKPEGRHWGKSICFSDENGCAKGINCF